MITIKMIQNIDNEKDFYLCKVLCVSMCAISIYIKIFDKSFLLSSFRVKMAYGGS